VGRLPIISLFVTLLALAGCVGTAQHGSNGSTTTTAGPPAPSAAPQPGASAGSGQTPRTTLPSAAARVGTEYRLSPLDIVEISVFQVPDLTKTVEINARGDIALPLIGTVQAGGKTTTELQEEIAAKLAKDYLQSPQVSVFVKEYRSQKVTVEGAVVSPGVYEIPGQASLLQVLAMAKGIDRVGDDNSVMIFRNIDGQRMAAAFDVDKIRKGENDDPQVLAGDTVVVGESQGAVAWRNIRESAGIASVFRPTVF